MAPLMDWQTHTAPESTERNHKVKRRGPAVASAPLTRLRRKVEHGKYVGFYGDQLSRVPVKGWFSQPAQDRANNYKGINEGVKNVVVSFDE